MASKLDFLLRARSDFFSCLEQRIKKVFDASATPSQPPPPLHQPQGTAALLDPSTLKKLLLPVFEHDIEISQSHASVSSTQCNVVYHVVKSTNSDRNEWMSVEFTRCSDSHAAEANMRNHLGTFARDVSEVTRPANIGSHSLQTVGRAGCVFWVRDTIYAEVFDNNVSGVPLEEDTGSGRPANVPPDLPPINLVTRVAQTIDQYLAEHTATPEKPQVALLTKNPMEVKAGERFTIKLAHHNDLHKVKPAEIEDWRLVLQLANGSAIGEYPFYALKAGKTKIRLVLAHKTSLAVAFQDVNITISDKTRPPLLTHPKEEGSTASIRNRQLAKSERSLKEASKESDNRKPKRRSTRLSTRSQSPSKKRKRDDDDNGLPSKGKRMGKKTGRTAPGAGT